jgi:hypothetical protein
MNNLPSMSLSEHAFEIAVGAPGGSFSFSYQAGPPVSVDAIVGTWRHCGSGRFVSTERASGGRRDGRVAELEAHRFGWGGIEQVSCSVCRNQASMTAADDVSRTGHADPVLERAIILRVT